MKGRRKKTFNLDSKRRREIVRYALHVGAADTEDFDRFLIAWYWHNPEAKDPLWSLMNAAQNMGGKLTEAEASAITKEASIMRQYRSADGLAKFLGVKYAQRQALRITTIGSDNVGKRARKVLRKHRARKRQEARRRSQGCRPRTEYEGNSLSATKPWEAEGMSRRSWERRGNKAVSQVRAQHSFFVTGEDALATTGARASERAFGPKKKQEDLRLATATTVAANRHASLPLELRLLALGLPLSVAYRAAA
jgi:hypothetical protein